MSGEPQGIALHRYGVILVQFINEVELEYCLWWLLYKCNFPFVGNGHTFAASFIHYPIAWTVSRPAVKIRLLTGPERV